MNTGASWPSLIEAESRVLAMQTKLHQWARDPDALVRHSNGMSTWRAGCGESRTSGSEGGPEKPIVRKARRRSGPTLHLREDVIGISVPGGGAGCLEPPGGGMVDGSAHLRTELVLDALNTAIWQRGPHGVVHHSDQGSQYTSIAFGARCKEAGVRPSTGSVGDAYDNALCESVFATLECELLERRSFRSHAEARMAIFEFLEGFYNRRRRHSALGYQSPAAFEDNQGQAAA